MTDNNDELGLAPLDDDELGLSPIADEDAEKPIAPEVSVGAGVRLIPVTCSACKTRMYAGEDQVGLWKRCPDCYRLTEIRAVPPKFILVADDPEAEGGYEIGEPEIDRRRVLQLQAEAKRLADLAAGKIRADLQDLPQGPPPKAGDDTPMLERALNRFLTSREEKEEQQKIDDERARQQSEVEAVKQATREGRLEEYLARSGGDPAADDPAARRNAERQRQFEAGLTPPPLPTPPQPGFSGEAGVLVPPPLPAPPPPPGILEGSESRPSPNPTAPPTGKRARLFAEKNAAEARRKGKPDRMPAFWAPLLAPGARSRMLFLIVCGLLGNSFGEKARAMILQALFDRVPGEAPGYMYNISESAFLVFSFWLGTALSAIWLALLFLFGISLFLETSQGKDRVENWVPFDLDFGCSYLGWSFWILTVAGFPGFLLWQGLSLLFPGSVEVFLPLHYAFQFLCFPILFLCVIESDTFLGKTPRKTVGSLVRAPWLWLRFYAVAALLVGVPLGMLVALFLAGATWADTWIMNSPLYYAVAAVLWTFSGFFVLLYFLRMGRLAWEIEQVSVQQ